MKLLLTFIVLFLSVSNAVPQSFSSYVREQKEKIKTDSIAKAKADSVHKLKHKYKPVKINPIEPLKSMNRK